MREERTEVLVVGAGPVGLLTAILLAEAGIEVRIIDREERTTVRSYACALHPRTLKLLDRMGLAAPMIERGRRVEKIAFYDGASRQAEVKLSQLGGAFPFMAILPQNVFEDALEQRLRKAGVAVNWKHRFNDLQSDAGAVAATVEELGATATGYIVPHWETVVKRSFPVHAQFLVGADGYGSLVRQRLGIEHTRVAGPEFFAAYEFEPAEKVEDEVRVVLDESSTNVLWPLLGNRCRWTFQLLKSEWPVSFPKRSDRGRGSPSRRWMRPSASMWKGWRKSARRGLRRGSKRSPGAPRSSSNSGSPSSLAGTVAGWRAMPPIKPARWECKA
jgi:2-polyprenyl-6-methoxyphenol hydroxylase-like FAD-dependent oxidoreductase